MAFELLGGGACVLLLSRLDRHFCREINLNIPLTYRRSVAYTSALTGEVLDVYAASRHCTMFHGIRSVFLVFHNTTTQQAKFFRHAVFGGWEA
jgi:hypothetical protein